MLKVYGIHGQTTAIVKIPVNDNSAWLELEFRRGRIGAGLQNRPATYSTVDPVVQAVIEGSPYFGRLISIVRVVGDEKRPAPNAAGFPTVIAHPEVFSKEDAVSFLKANGAKAVNLKDDDSIQKYAAKIGVSFPNLYD
ncbi:MAG: hypothetical protein IKW99_03420 [Bacteroidales bacterium]|nr:hypothetical protein [Bacteroidales bacterium]